MVTAYGRDEVEAAAEAAGFDSVLTKPVNPSQLFDAVMRALGEPLAAEPVPGGTGSAEPELASIAGARLLLAEDNELNQEVAVELLHDVGLQVEVAGDGREALDRLLQHEAGYYDAVLMDMQMPVLDGIGSTLELRKLPQFASLPIIAMTANAMQGDRERCLEAGMNDYVGQADRARRALARPAALDSGARGAGCDHLHPARGRGSQAAGHPRARPGNRRRGRR